MGAYYRTTSSMGFGGFTMTPAVKFLLIVNAVLFVIPALLGINPNRLWLLLVPGLAVRGMIWQPFTYMFFHGGLSHFLFNMLFLWMFGTTVEQTWGTRRFLRYYLACGVAAGMAVVVAGLMEGTRQALYTATVGSSGAIYGLILAFGLLFPERPRLVHVLLPHASQVLRHSAGMYRILPAEHPTRQHHQPHCPTWGAWPTALFTSSTSCGVGR